MAPRKLVFFTSLPEIGGHTTITLGLVQHLKGMFDRILIVAKEMPSHGTSSEAMKSLIDQGIDTIVLRSNGWREVGRAMAYMLRKGWWRPDAYLAMGMRHLSPVLAVWLMARRSFYYHITHDMQPSTERMLRLYARVFTAIGFISPATEGVWIAGVGRGSQTFSAIQPSDVASVESSKIFSEGAVRFGFIGRLTEGKGCAVLVDFLRNCETACSLRVAGSGEYGEIFREMAGEGSDGHVSLRFDGPFSPNERESYLADFFSSIDYLVVPSQDDREGIPTVILEALAAGVPVIATRTGGIRAFEHPDFGWADAPCVTLVAPNAVADTMQSLAREKPPGQGVQQACRNYYQARFSNKAVEEAWRCLFLDPLGTLQFETLPRTSIS